MTELVLSQYPVWLPARLRALWTYWSHLNPMGVVLTFTLCTLAAVWIFAATYLVAEYDRSLAAGRASAASYARAVEEHAVRTFQAADQTVVFFKYLVEQKGPALDVAHYLQNGIVMAEIFNLISIIDEHGDVRSANEPFPPVNLAEREHFQVHLQSDSQHLYISKPVLGRVSGKWSIQMTRRANKPDGSLLAVVVISMDPLYFSHFYQQIEPGTQTMVALVGNDGIVRARRVGGEESLAQDVHLSRVFQAATQGAPSGEMNTQGGIDGVGRLFAYRRLAGYPLFALVGLDREEALKPYYRARTNTLAWAIASTLVLLAFYRIMRGLIEHLESSRREALAASQAKSHFLSTMSHELRTPLHGILGYAELLAEETETPLEAKFVAAINQSGRHLLNLVNDILDLGRIEAGRMEFFAKPIDLHRLLQEIDSTHRASAAIKGLQLLLEIGEAVPTVIRTDETKLKQILNNLLHNAIKFTERGSVRLRARHDDGTLRLEVMDTGCGIALPDQEHVFEKFVQADASHARAHAGTGLGLALVRELAQLLGAKVTLDSRPGKGSRFTVSLPLNHIRVHEEREEMSE
jgi:signal transduction histidine kinase